MPSAAGSGRSPARTLRPQSAGSALQPPPGFTSSRGGRRDPFIGTNKSRTHSRPQSAVSTSAATGTRGHQQVPGLPHHALPFPANAALLMSQQTANRTGLPTGFPASAWGPLATGGLPGPGMMYSMFGPNLNLGAKDFDPTKPSGVTGGMANKMTTEDQTTRGVDQDFDKLFDRFQDMEKRLDKQCKSEENAKQEMLVYKKEVKILRKNLLWMTQDREKLDASDQLKLRRMQKKREAEANGYEEPGFLMDKVKSAEDKAEKLKMSTDQ